MNGWRGSARQTSPLRTLHVNGGKSPKLAPMRRGARDDAKAGAMDTDLGLGLERWVSVREAARVAAVDPRTIRRWADTGRIRARRTPGGHRQISVSGLGAAYSATTHKPGHAADDRDPAEVIPDWAATSPMWAHWRPPRRLSDDDLASLRLDIASCHRALDEVNNSVTIELRRRDEAAVALEPDQFRL